jgi:hypothetical protein
MMSDYLRPPTDILVSLINADNGTILQAEDCLFGLPQPAVGAWHPRNTVIYVSLISRPTEHPVRLMYNRLAIQEALPAGVVPDFTQDGAQYVSELMERINTRLALSLSEADYVDAAIEEGVTTEPVELEVQITQSSLLFTGPLRIRLLPAEVTAPLSSLSQAIAVTQLGPLTGLLDSSTEVLTRAINLVNDVNFDDLDLSFGLVSGAGVDVTMGIRAGANSGHTGSVTVSYNRVDLDDLRRASSAIFLLGDETSLVSLLPAVSARWAARIGEADILDGTLPGFLYPMETESAEVVLQSDAQSKIYTGETTLVLKRQKIAIAGLPVKVLDTLELADLVTGQTIQGALLTRINTLNFSDLRAEVLDANYHRLSAEPVVGNECEITFSVKLGLPNYVPGTGFGTAFTGGAEFVYSRFTAESLVVAGAMGSLRKDTMLTTHDYAARLLASLGILFEPLDWLLASLPDSSARDASFELTASAESLTYQGSATAVLLAEPAGG